MTLRSDDRIIADLEHGSKLKVGEIGCLMTANNSRVLNQFQRPEASSVRRL